LKRLAYYELRMQEEDLFGELEPEEKSQAGAFVGEIKGITKVESVGLEAEEIKLAKRGHTITKVFTSQLILFGGYLDDEMVK